MGGQEKRLLLRSLRTPTGKSIHHPLPPSHPPTSCLSMSEDPTAYGPRGAPAREVLSETSHPPPPRQQPRQQEGQGELPCLGPAASSSHNHLPHALPPPFSPVCLWLQACLAQAVKGRECLPSAWQSPSREKCQWRHPPPSCSGGGQGQWAGEREWDSFGTTFCPGL